MGMGASRAAKIAGIKRKKHRRKSPSVARKRKTNASDKNILSYVWNKLPMGSERNVIRKLDMLNLRQGLRVKCNKDCFSTVPIIRSKHHGSIVFCPVCFMCDEEWLIHIHIWATPKSFL